MQLSRRSFIGASAAFATWQSVFGVPPPGKGNFPWEKPSGTASDSIMARRLYLDLAGRLPTEDEARAYAKSENPAKRSELVDALLASDDFANYWAMRFADILRVKSEFPINLWPNSVYVYHRRIRAFVKGNEPWDAFGRALVLGSGSDFRNPEANFYRATPIRTPAGWAEAVAQTFLNLEPARLPAAERDHLAQAFTNLRIKSTREWKEEIVYTEGPDPRLALADELFLKRKDEIARAFSARLREWIFGPGYEVEDPAANSANFRLKDNLRAIVMSRDYAAGSISGRFPLRRLDAEIIDDTLRTLSDTPRNLQSPAPEPFTFLPPKRDTVDVEDGSISDGFLTLFGRPARDTGLMGERNPAVTPKQRLLLFNSGNVHRELGKIVYDKKLNSLNAEQRLRKLYWSLLSRAPSADELKILNADRLARGKNARDFYRDVAWALINSREFLYRV